MTISIRKDRILRRRQRGKTHRPGVRRPRLRGVSRVPASLGKGGKRRGARPCKVSKGRKTRVIPITQSGLSIVEEDGSVTQDARGCALDLDIQPDVLQGLIIEPLLTAEEEIDHVGRILLARRARLRLARGRLGGADRARVLTAIADGTAAQERIVLANIRLVVCVAARYKSCNIPLSELIQEGVIGLIRAIGKYDPDRGIRFSTYATWWIRQAISRSLENGIQTIRVPAQMHVRVRKMLRTSRVLARKLGRDPTNVEISEALGLDAESVRAAIAASRPTNSLEMPQDEDGDRTLLDTYQDRDALSPEEIVTRGLLSEQIYTAFKSLSAREASILLLRFGFADGRRHTLQEIGDQYGLSRERIRQLQDKALDQLRNQSSELRGLAG